MRYPYAPFMPLVIIAASALIAYALTLLGPPGSYPGTPHAIENHSQQP